MRKRRKIQSYELFANCFEDGFKITHSLKKGKYLPRLCGGRRLSARFSSLLAQIGKLDKVVRGEKDEYFEEDSNTILVPV